jgi:hypothetical protein
MLAPGWSWASCFSRLNAKLVLAKASLSWSASETAGTGEFMSNIRTATKAHQPREDVVPPLAGDLFAATDPLPTNRWTRSAPKVSVTRWRSEEGFIAPKVLLPIR